MPTKEEIINALQNPLKAPFMVAFELFASPDREQIAKLPRKLRAAENTPAEKFLFRKERFTQQEAETAKANHIKYIRDSIITQDRLIDRLEKHTERYNKIKEYLEEKIKELKLQITLIFFDDKALRIDIGYGPKEFQAIFSDFLAYGGVFDLTILGGCSSFTKTPSQVFEEHFLHDDYADLLKAEGERLIRASCDFTSLPHGQKIILGDTTNLKEAVLIERCLKENPGVVIGEVHTDASPKQFLIDNMATLKSQGVTTLFMEHLLHESHQVLLDTYLKAPLNSPMPRGLELYLNYLDKERCLSGGATFTVVVKVAKEQGIRIVAIDSEASYRMGVTKSIKDLNDVSLHQKRYKAMNMAMFERYKQYKDGGKYVVFIGSAHVSSCEGVPGVSDLLGCPNMVISDLKKDESQEVIEQNIHYHYGAENKTIDFDILYHRDPKTKIVADLATEPVDEFLVTPIYNDETGDELIITPENDISGAEQEKVVVTEVSSSQQKAAEERIYIRIKTIYNQILVPINEKIGLIEQHKWTVAYTAATTLLAALKAALDTYQKNLLNPSGINKNIPTELFIGECKDAIKTALPVLENDLALGDYLKNLLKSIYNLVAQIFSDNKSSFFKIEESQSAKAVKEMQTELDKSLGTMPIL